MGIIPAKDVVIAKDKVSFQTTKFGVFQLGRAETKIADRVNVPSVQPPAPKRDASNPLIGGWGTCETGGSGVEFREPTFKRPVWTNMDVGREGARLVFRGASDQISVTRYSDAACKIPETTQSTVVKGFLAMSAIGNRTAYFSMKDPDGNTSSCQAAFPVSPFIEVINASRSASFSGGQLEQNFQVRWNGSGAAYTVQAFQNANCSGSSAVQEVVSLSAGEFSFGTDFTGFQMNRELSFKIVDTSGVHVGVECMRMPLLIPGVTQTPATAANPALVVNGMQVNKYSTDGQFSFDVMRVPSSSASASYELSFYTDAACTQINMDQLLLRFNQNSIATHLKPNSKSIKVLDVSGVSPVASPVCVTTATLPAAASFERYHAGSNFVSLNWRSDDPVRLEQFSGVDCVGTGQAIVVNTDSAGRQVTWVNVNNLKPNSLYSFKLISVAGPALCQNVMTTASGAPDWSAGNTKPWTNQSTAAFEFSSEVKDGRDDYKVHVSINGQLPVDSYSEPIPKSGSAVVNLAQNLAANNIITLWAPSGCRFVSANKMKFSALPIPISYFGESTGNPTIICDGSSDSEGNGGGDMFGGYPTMRAVSKAMSIKITNGAFTMIEDLFDSANCAVGTRISSKIEQGALVLPGQDFLKETIPIDVTSKDLAGAIFTDSGVTAANKIDQAKFGCGLTGWIKGQRMSLKGSTCGKDLGRTKYERLKIVGDRLYICEISGDEDAYGMTPEMRIPSCDINRESFFLKRQ
jgi:hypothetical protein